MARFRKSREKPQEWDKPASPDRPQSLYWPRRGQYHVIGVKQRAAIAILKPRAGSHSMYVLAVINKSSHVEWVRWGAGDGWTRCQMKKRMTVGVMRGVTGVGGGGWPSSAS